jgi:hypothetical protein
MCADVFGDWLRRNDTGLRLAGPTAHTLAGQLVQPLILSAFLSRIHSGRWCYGAPYDVRGSRSKIHHPTTELLRVARQHLAQVSREPRWLSRKIVFQGGRFTLASCRS